jgi:hypothetical protein
MTSLEQGWHKIGGQATGADNNDFHFILRFNGITEFRDSE